MRFSSRKFLLALVSFLMIVANRVFTLELPVELEVALVSVVVIYLGAEASIDYKAVSKK